MTETNPMKGRIIPTGFPSKRDRELYMFALERIEAGHKEDIKFYLQRANRGFVLKDGKAVQISYGGKF